VPFALGLAIVKFRLFLRFRFETSGKIGAERAIGLAATGRRCGLASAAGLPGVTDIRSNFAIRTIKTGGPLKLPEPR